MLAKDVVCGMQVNAGDFEVTYKGLPYSFCSPQCRERFEANPHLYIGMPGHKAPKQQGASIVKQRRLRLAEPLTASQAQAIYDALRGMMGIEDVSAEGDSVVIRYDLLQATAEQIEQKLSAIGVQLGKGWSESLRRAFVHYAEETEVGNLEVREHKHVHRH